MSRTVGGRLDMRALGLLAGAEHRPRDRETLRAAAVELRARGLTARDIGEALGLSERAVRVLMEGGV
ncbi:MAG TPA: helix-turn-helix domain-containing protein [Steroidobacteraceae bacterium]|nr:helix-turn-helix domain-containing protein [Steroidobacteraceae bacterium]